MKNGLIFLFVLLIDQVTKCVAVANKNWHANTGISFGLFPRFPLWLLFGLVLLMLCFMILYRIKFNLKWSLFMAGMSGNFVDRVRFGYIVDWISLPFPIIGRLYVNIADIALIIGFICFIFNGFYQSEKDTKEQKLM